MIGSCKEWARLSLRAQAAAPGAFCTSSGLGDPPNSSYPAPAWSVSFSTVTTLGGSSTTREGIVPAQWVLLIHTGPSPLLSALCWGPLKGYNLFEPAKVKSTLLSGHVCPASGKIKMGEKTKRENSSGQLRADRQMDSVPSELAPPLGIWMVGPRGYRTRLLPNY